ncbi:MAG TPA: hypothetical protein VIH99_00465 [Bdellovibrionota bacterium]|jgi:hypothetical protein
MNYVKYFFATAAAVFFFALGIYFQDLMPANVREPASLSAPIPAHANAKFDSKATEAFRACLDSKVKNGSVTIGKVNVEGRRWSIVSIPCMGDAAKELYNAIQPYSSEEYVRYRDKRRGVVRFFGRLYPPSQCVELISSGKGKTSNEYSCSIRIDVDSEITEQLKL